MPVENWPKIAERIAREYGGEPFAGPRPADKWGYRLVAGGVATRGRDVELGSFAFPSDPGMTFAADVVEAIAGEDGDAEVVNYALGRPKA